MPAPNARPQPSTPGRPMAPFDAVPLIRRAAISFYPAGTFPPRRRPTKPAALALFSFAEAVLSEESWAAFVREHPEPLDQPEAQP